MLDFDEIEKDEEVMSLYVKFCEEFCPSDKDGNALPCKCKDGSLLKQYCQRPLCFAKWVLENDKYRKAGKFVKQLWNNSKEGKASGGKDGKSLFAPLQVGAESGIIGAIFSGLPDEVKSKVTGVAKEALAETLRQS